MISSINDQSSILDITRAEIEKTDSEMSRLFSARMNEVQRIAQYKLDRGLPILDRQREEEIINKNVLAFANSNSRLLTFYLRFIKEMIAISKDYQMQLMGQRSIAVYDDQDLLSRVKEIYGYTDTAAFSSPSDAYRAVESGKCTAAIIPINTDVPDDALAELIFSGSLYMNYSFAFADEDSETVKTAAVFAKKNCQSRKNDPSSEFMIAVTSSLGESGTYDFLNSKGYSVINTIYHGSEDNSFPHTMLCICRAVPSSSASENDNSTEIPDEEENISFRIIGKYTLN